MKIIKLLSSLLIALLLTLVPVSMEFHWYLPQFCLLVLFSWAYLQPNFINVGTAWVIGLLLDVITGSLLGLHALALVLVLYIFLLFHARIIRFHMIQQSLIIGCLALLNGFIVFCLQSMFSDVQTSVKIMSSAILTAVSWPVVLFLITLLSRSRKKISWDN